MRQCEKHKCARMTRKTQFVIAGIVFLAAGFLAVFNLVKAASTFSSTNRWAWNDVIGWIDFYFDDTNVTSSNLEGYASSSVGYIGLDCATSPNGNICSGGGGNWKVTNTSGELSGYAWNDNIGWISFNCDNTSTCATSQYQVNIDVNSDFDGYAWNDIVGWVSFNCSNTGTCSTVSYKVNNTSWFISPTEASTTSSTFDTELSNGAAFNSLTFIGSKPSGTSVKFKFASSNCSNGATDAPTCAADASWDNKFVGDDGATTSFYTPLNQNTPVLLRTQDHNNKRYFRYLIYLYSDAGRLYTPTATDVVINWSR